MKKLTPKQQAKYAEKKILEDNEDFYKEIIATHYPKERKRVKYIVGWAGSAATVVLTIVLCLVFLLPSGTDNPIIPDPPDNPKHYLLENEVTVPSDLTELNLSMQNVLLNIDVQQYEYKIRRTYDSESNDNLFFWISITGDDTFETINIYVYVNPDYEHQKQIEGEPIIPTNIGGFQVNYKETVIKDSDDIFTFNYTARAEYNDIAVYIEYEQLWFEEETNFFNFFEDTIKKL